MKNPFDPECTGYAAEAACQACACCFCGDCAGALVCVATCLAWIKQAAQ